MAYKFVQGRYAEIANRLRQVRYYFDLPSKGFAEQAGVSIKSYSQWESGDFRISIDGAIAICTRFGITLDYVYFGRIDTLPYGMAIGLSQPERKLNSVDQTKKAPIAAK